MTKKPVLYLAGPMSGMSWAQATSWRNVIHELLGSAFEIRDPFRGKPDLEGMDHLPHNAESIFGGDRAIFRRDRHDVRGADVVLTCFLHAQQASIGTCVELGWADAWQIPVVTLMDEDNVHSHPFVREISSFLVHRLGDALNVLLSLFPAHGPLRCVSDGSERLPGQDPPAGQPRVEPARGSLRVSTDSPQLLRACSEMGLYTGD